MGLHSLQQFGFVNTRVDSWCLGRQESAGPVIARVSYGMEVERFGRVDLLGG